VIYVKTDVYLVKNFFQSFHRMVHFTKRT